VFAFRGVEHLEVVDHVPSCVVARRVCAPSDPLPFQKLEEALGNGVVVTIFAPAFAGFEIALALECLPLTVGEPRSLIGMLNHAGFAGAANS
jgi:hypothetical protein